MSISMKRMVAVVLAIVPLTGSADELFYSGFMSDYSQLTKVTDGSVDYRYLAPDALDRLVKYNAVMIDQPEVFIAVDSPYRGVKPKHLNALAESLRAGLAGALADDIYVVDRPADHVLYVTVAITNLKLAKRKKKPLQYLPVALVAGGIAGAASSEIAKKADFSGLVFEFEAFDSISGERIVAIIDSLEPVPGAAEPESWADVDALMARYGSIISCRFHNARLPENQRAECLNEGA